VDEYVDSGFRSPGLSPLLILSPPLCLALAPFNRPLGSVLQVRVTGGSGGRTICPVSVDLVPSEGLYACSYTGPTEPGLYRLEVKLGPDLDEELWGAFSHGS
jgi:hypothetical protein